LRPSGVHRPYLSTLDCDPVEIMEGLLWVDSVSVCKDSGDLELLVDHADIDFFDLGTKLCQNNKPVSSSGANMDNRVGLLATAPEQSYEDIS
jgi:hypothetical protein